MDLDGRMSVLSVRQTADRNPGFGSQKRRVGCQKRGKRLRFVQKRATLLRFVQNTATRFVQNTATRFVQNVATLPRFLQNTAAMLGFAQNTAAALGFAQKPANLHARQNSAEIFTETLESARNLTIRKTKQSQRNTPERMHSPPDHNISWVLYGAGWGTEETT